MNTWRKVSSCLLAGVLSTTASAADFATGTTDDPTATETCVGSVTYCLVFKNAAQAWTFTPSFNLRVDKLLVVGGGGSGGCDCGAGRQRLYRNYIDIGHFQIPRPGGLLIRVE